MTQNEETEIVVQNEEPAESVMGFDQGRQWLRNVLIELCGADYNTARHLRDWLLPDHLFDQYQNAVDILITDKEVLTLHGYYPALRISQRISQSTEQTGLIMEISSLKELVKAFQTYERLRPHLEDFSSTLYGMTASDIKNPTLYWRQLAKSFENRANYADVKRRKLRLGEEVRVESWQRPSEHPFYPYPLVTESTVILDSDGDNTPLPTVNWRIHSEWITEEERSQEVLTVSQIQTQQKSPTSVEQAKIDDVTMRGRLRNLMAFAQTHPRTWKYLFPELPPLPRTVQNLEAWNQVVSVVSQGASRDELLGRGEQFIIQHLQDDLQLSQQQAREIFNQYLTVVRGCRALEGRLDEPRKAREAQSLQFKLFTKLDQAIPEDWHRSANQLAEEYEQGRFPLAKYLSLLLLVSWMHRRGMTVLRFPTILPFQIHGERRDNQEGKLDRRIISHLQLVFEQLEKDVDGIKWRMEPSQDGYAELKIGADLRSSYRWVESVLFQ